MIKKLPNIYEYDNYRAYLKAYYDVKKTPYRHGFSFKVFASKVGFSSTSTMQNVITGIKNLSPRSAEKVAKGMHLDKNEAAYFTVLVRYNQTDTPDNKKLYLEMLNSLAAVGLTDRIPKIQKDQYDFYAQWFNVVVRSLIDMYPFKDNYKKLGDMINPKLKPQQVKGSVKLLERLGLIIRQRNGYYKIADKVIHTGPDIRSQAVRNFHIENLALAKHATKNLPREKRNISGLTLGISNKTYTTVCKIIERCQSEIMVLAEKDKKADRVYQLGFQLFPLTQP